jgi:hypothetical protein
MPEAQRFNMSVQIPRHLVELAEAQRHTSILPKRKHHQFISLNTVINWIKQSGYSSVEKEKNIRIAKKTPHGVLSSFLRTLQTKSGK